MSWLQLIFSGLLIFVSVASFSKSELSASKIVVFGDSLSDTGTYSHVAGPKGGGKFTTNPAPIWIEIVGKNLGLDVKPNRFDGFGQPTVFLNGTNYAQGGSRILQETEKNPDKPGASAVPIATQVGYFLVDNLKFSTNDLVFVQGGANDLFVQMNGLKNGTVKPPEAIANMVQAAKDLGAILANIQNSGAPKIAVINLPQIETTPRVLALDPQVQGLVKTMVQTFNSQLISETERLKVKLVDFYSFDAGFNKEHGKYGIDNVTAPACLLDVLPNNSSLFCSSKTLVQPQADETYKYADGVHPTAAYSRIVAEFIEQQIK